MALRFEKKRYLSAEWRELRERLLDVRGYKCKECGHSPEPAYRRGRIIRGMGLEVHHVRPETSGFMASDEDLVVLCKSCHSRAGKSKPLSDLQKQWEVMAHEVATTH
ncbi:MAG: HNH endonuclease [Gemmatimonadetes bacterium]|nr:HNH endonuclease [Gemmatimonadota bacterium]